MKQGTIYDHGLDNSFSHEAVELQEHLPRETEQCGDLRHVVKESHSGSSLTLGFSSVFWSQECSQGV